MYYPDIKGCITFYFYSISLLEPKKHLLQKEDPTSIQILPRKFYESFSEMQIPFDDVPRRCAIHSRHSLKR